MLSENNDFQVNNPAPAPIPEPLPELKQTKAQGGFSGAINRFCSEESPAPVQQMPDFTIGKGVEAPQNVVSEPQDNSTKNDFQTAVIPQEQNNPTTQVYQQGKFTLPKEEPKSKKGVITLIFLMSVVLILACATFCIQLFDTDKKSYNKSINNIPEGTSPDYYSQEIPEDYDAYYEAIVKSVAEPTTTSNKGSFTNKKWSGIVLENQPDSSKNHSAQFSFEKVAPSTVGVLCYTDEIDGDESAENQGTGIIISSDGYIVTNSHVVGDSTNAYKYQIIDENGKSYKASVVGYDTRTDIAVLKIKANNLKPVPFCKTSEVKIGDDIIAVGNPCGINFQNSLTKGIVSAKDRTLPDSNVTYIQTDAAINPGNSGGPLCNLYGQVVGITTAKINSDMYEGMGFAIPSDTVKKIADNIIKNGYVKDRVKIGIIGTAITQSISEMYDVPMGIMITKIDKDSDLNNTKVKPKDIITEINGNTITNFSDIYAELEKHQMGDKVEITVYRHKDNNKDGTTFTEVIILGNE